MNKKNLVIFTLILAGLFQFGYNIPEEGMFPLSEIHKVDLKTAGLKIEA